MEVLLSLFNLDPIFGIILLIIGILITIFANFYDMSICYASCVHEFDHLRYAVMILGIAVSATGIILFSLSRKYLQTHNDR